MANTNKITIEINKEIAKEAYEAGARWAFNDDDGILTIEGFEIFWAKIESGLANADTGENNALLPDVSSLVCPTHGTKLYKHPNGLAYCSLCNYNIKWQT